MNNTKLYKDRRDFLRDLRELDRQHNVRLNASELKAVVNALSERDETAEICTDKHGNAEPDTQLRDTENIPLKETIEKYFAREVKPYMPDAIWQIGGGAEKPDDIWQIRGYRKDKELI